MTGCSYLGTLYEEGKGVRQSYKKARELYLQACTKPDFGDSLACYGLGILYSEGKGLRQNKTTAKEYFGKACDMEVQAGCDEYRRLNEQGY